MTQLPDTRHHSFQSEFNQKWAGLLDPHVRALAWLLDSPDLLDPSSAQWKGRIAEMPLGAAQAAREWLYALDHDPQQLHQWLSVHPLTRLGKYAEKLIAWYFRYQEILVAHGVQVRSENVTVGEFDFLLRKNGRLVHWELATKFYLLQGVQSAAAIAAVAAIPTELEPSPSENQNADYFVGPNLADTLGAKMTKIIGRQLALSGHPAAREVLTEPVAEIGALIKGWLFYHDDHVPDPAFAGLHPEHCRGFWREEATLASLSASGDRFLVLSRLQWLAPALASETQTMDLADLKRRVRAHFSTDTMPLMVAVMAPQAGGNNVVEVERGFIVPDEWEQRAGLRLRR